ncbi:MAG: cytochrome P450, partial [Candidatus Dadabacteria bacterium]
MTAVAQPIPTAPRPIPDGARLLGLPEIPKMLRDPIGWGRERYDRYGPVSWGSFLGQRVLIMLGPDANEFVLMNRGNIFSSKMGWNYYIEPYFRRGIMLRDFDEHRAHRRIMQGAFQREALARYLEQMNPDIDRLIERWQPRRDRRIVPVFPTVKQLTLDLASGIFLGEELGPVAD